MRFYTRILAFALVLTTVASLFSCVSHKEKYEEYSFEYFDTVTVVSGYESNEDRFREISAKTLAVLEEYHKLYDIYKTYQGVVNLATLNACAGQAPLKVDKRIIDLLLYAKSIYTLTGGMTNIAMGSVLEIWHDFRERGISEPHLAQLPEENLLKESGEHTDIDNLIIDEESLTVQLLDEKMSIDVGAIAKGYAVEMAAQELEAIGISGYILNVGGNVRVIGAKPEGEHFVAGIESPDTEEYLALVKLKDNALVTSGSYQRFYTVNGVSYHHIIDPETLFPSDRFRSVSVIAEHSGMADALSTALFVMDIDEGKGLIEGISGVEALWLTEDGEIFTSSGWADFLAED